MAILTLWVVDNASTAVLMNENSPVCLTVSQDVVGQLDKVGKFAYLYKHTHHSTVVLPDGVADITVLVSLGLIKALGDKVYGYNGKTYRLCDYRHLVSNVPTNLAHALSHAIQLIRWKDDHRFCSRCGTPTFVHPDEYASTCPSCHYRSYPRIQPCVISAITRICPSSQKPQILLALHRRHSDTGMHGLIAGFVEIGESLESAVVRESLEETGLLVGDIRYITSQPWPYPTNLMVGFTATYQAGELNADESELIYAKFFDLDDLPPIPQEGTIARALIEHILSTNS